MECGQTPKRAEAATPLPPAQTSSRFERSVTGTTVRWVSHLSRSELIWFGFTVGYGDSGHGHETVKTFIARQLVKIGPGRARGSGRIVFRPRFPLTLERSWRLHWGGPAYSTWAGQPKPDAEPEVAQSSCSSPEVLACSYDIASLKLPGKLTVHDRLKAY